MCGRPRDCCSRFILSWLGTNETKKMRRSHFEGDAVFYEQFRDGLYTLFGRLDFADAYCQQLRVLAQSGSESVAAFASRTSDLSTRAYPDCLTKRQLDLTVDHFISGLRDLSTRDYLRRERARRRIEWQEAAHMVQACEAPHAAELTPPLPAACVVSTICTKPVNFAHIASLIADYAIAALSAIGNSWQRALTWTFPDKPHVARVRTTHKLSQHPLCTARAVTKARWSFDPSKGAPLRAPLKLSIPNSEWNFSPYTGYAWSQPFQQYVPLNLNNQSSTQLASRPSTQHSAPHQSASAFAAPLPLPLFPGTSSGNYPVALRPHTQTPSPPSRTTRRNQTG